MKIWKSKTTKDWSIRRRAWSQRGQMKSIKRSKKSRRKKIVRPILATLEYVRPQIIDLKLIDYI